MHDDTPLRPSHAVAIFPFGVVASPVDGRQADLCRGLAVLVERRLGRLPGVQPLLQNLFISPESDPGKKGWLLTNSLWSLDQALSLPIANGEKPSHLIQGLLTFEDDSIQLEMELIDLEGGYSLARETRTGAANALTETFFRAFRPIASSLMESASAGRVVTRLPTRDAEAFQLLVLGLASAQAHAQGMVGAPIPLRLLTEAVEKDGELIEALQELERLVGALNMEDEETRGLVVACLARARAAAPGNTGLLATEGLIHARQGRAAEAAPLLEKYLQSDSRGELASQAMTALARIQRQQNNIGGARRLLHAAITASPENASAWEDLADCHQESGEAAQAEECWRRALQEDPDRARSLAALGEVYAKRGDAERAAPLLERALLLGEERGRVTPHLIECHLTAGRLDGADALATDWVEEHPESLTAWMCLTRVRHKLKDAPAVTRCLAEARRLGTTPRQQADISMLDFSLRQPFEFAEYRRVGLLHSIGAKEAETLAWKLTAGVYAREAHPDILMLAARLAERAGNVQLAAKCLAEALTRLGDAPVSERLRLVRLYSEAGDRPAAKAALTAVEAVSPGNAEAASIRRTLDSQVAVEPPPEPVASPVEVAVTVEEAEPAGFLTRLNRWLSGLLGR